MKISKEAHDNLKNHTFSMCIYKHDGEGISDLKEFEKEFDLQAQAWLARLKGTVLTYIDRQLKTYSNSNPVIKRLEIKTDGEYWDGDSDYSRDANAVIRLSSVLHYDASVRDEEEINERRLRELKQKDEDRAKERKKELEMYQYLKDKYEEKK